MLESRRSTDQGVLFPRTRWSLIQAMGGEDEPSRAMALEELCEIYWKPIYLYLRGRGQSRADAEDLTQAFFGVLLERRGLEGLSALKGRLRAYLLQAVRNFVVSDWKHRMAQKRGGHAEHFSFNSADVERLYQGDRFVHGDSPERLYERQWALTLIERSLQRLRDEYEAIGKMLLFELVSPLLEHRGKWRDHEDLCCKLDMSEGNLRVALHRMRKRFRSLLEDEISQTLTSDSDVKDELRYLLTVLAAK